MTCSSSPPGDGVRSMLLIFLMEATVYSLDPLLLFSSRWSPRHTPPLPQPWHCIEWHELSAIANILSTKICDIFMVLGRVRKWGWQWRIFPKKPYVSCIQPYTRDSESHFGKTSDNSVTFHFESHGHGVMRMEKPNLSHLTIFDSFYVLIPTYFV